MYAVHGALRRELELVARVTVRVGNDPRRVLRTAAGWRQFKETLRTRHRAEDGLLWPALRRQLADRPDELVLLEALEARTRRHRQAHRDDRRTVGRPRSRPVPGSATSPTPRSRLGRTSHARGGISDPTHRAGARRSSMGGLRAGPMKHRLSNLPARRRLQAVEDQGQDLLHVPLRQRTGAQEPGVVQRPVDDLHGHVEVGVGP
jgi:hypothetical protein